MSNSGQMMKNTEAYFKNTEHEEICEMVISLVENYKSIYTDLRRHVTNTYVTEEFKSYMDILTHEGNRTSSNLNYYLKTEWPGNHHVWREFSQLYLYIRHCEIFLQFLDLLSQSD